MREIRANAPASFTPAWTRTNAVKAPENVVQVSQDDEDAAESGAVDAAITSDSHSEVPFQNGDDSALRLLAEVWGELSDSEKNQILKLVDNAASRSALDISERIRSRLAFAVGNRIT